MRFTILALALVGALALAVGALAGGAATAGLPQEKLAAAEQAYRGSLAELEAGMGAAEPVYFWSLRWLESALQAGQEPAAARRAHLERMQALEKLLGTRIDQGMAPATGRAAAAYYRLEAELGAKAGR